MKFSFSFDVGSFSFSKFPRRLSGYILLFFLIACFWPGVALFSVFRFWFFEGPFLAFVVKLFVLLLLGGLIDFWLVIAIFSATYSRFQTVTFPALGGALWTGVAEALLFRWMAFYGIVDLLVGGDSFFLKGALGQLCQQTVLPVLNVLTFGSMQHAFAASWAVGVALLVVAFGRFQRTFLASARGFWLPLLNWPVGFLLGWTLLQHGLFVSMLLNVLYCLFECLVFPLGTKYAVDKIMRKYKSF